MNAIPSPTIVIVRNELRSLMREQTFIMLLGIFLCMTFFSVYIGWSTRTTTNAIYHTSVVYLAAQGITNVPRNPLTDVSSLLIFDNMLIYILLIGALLAIVIGHRSFVRERKSGILPLIFVRPVSRSQYAFSKLFGIFLALAGIMAATYAVSALSALLIPALHLTGTEFIRLLCFYAVSLLYLCLFAALGLFFGILMSNESTALFMPILLWVAAVFILPELTTGQNPVSLLNPVTLASAPSNQGPLFTTMHAILGPFSVGQFYTQSGLWTLGAVSGGSFIPILALFCYVGCAVGVCIFIIKRNAIATNLSL